MAPSNLFTANYLGDKIGNWVSPLQQVLHSNFFFQIRLVFHYCLVSMQFVLRDLHTDLLSIFRLSTLQKNVCNHLWPLERRFETAASFFCVHKEQSVMTNKKNRTYTRLGGASTTTASGSGALNTKTDFVYQR